MTDDSCSVDDDRMVSDHHAADVDPFPPEQADHYDKPDDRMTDDSLAPEEDGP